MTSKKPRLSETERFIELWHEEESFWNILSGNYKVRQEKEKVLEEYRKNWKWQVSNHFFKMPIWILVLWMIGTVVSEAYSEPTRTSNMELFARITKGFQPLNNFFINLPVFSPQKNLLFRFRFLLTIFIFHKANCNKFEKTVKVSLFVVLSWKLKPFFSFFSFILAVTLKSFYLKF